ncbi:MAG: 50S ribosomal protein L21 [Candidatus Roizmanbacteria bacterium]|nr:50S ribosomal protein L21 [Candidatus Roizmanbacteria bacterium]
MKTHAVIKVQGKQYITKAGDELVIENVNQEEGSELSLPVIMYFDENSAEIEIPTKEVAGTAKVLENLKGEKIRIAKFKSKVRYRKVRGFRQQLTKIQIINI